MAEAKIQIKLGAIEFLGESDEKWVAGQLDKILTQAANLLKLAPATTAKTDSWKSNTEKSDGNSSEFDTDVPLSTFLKNMNAGTNQVKRFLVTAIWLSGRGNSKPTTKDVANALKDSHQTKLTNPAESLNQNVKKGFCEKIGKQFFVTPNGFGSVRS
ncbi:hypothetical protein L0337_30325 [candidate division KSB1 bacterium]|nr:hypothetical protein [candidate division KSB1 bacterium]